MSPNAQSPEAYIEPVAAAKPASPPVKALAADRQSNTVPPEGIWKPTPQLSRRSDVLYYAIDPANCVSLAGAACGFLSLAASAEGALDKAIGFILLAVFLDLFDGVVARGTTHLRSAVHGLIGAELDSFADNISTGLAVSLLLVRLGAGSVPVTLVAVVNVLLVTSRLAYFNVHGCYDGSYVGMTVDKNGVAVAYAYILGRFLGFAGLSLAYCILPVVCVFNMLNVLSFLLPKAKDWSPAWVLEVALAVGGMAALGVLVATDKGGFMT